ncbi:hypothetical protein [uncultured Psychroserpens sp.]|uniref:hypothetical protein n=1 Tax=uncultured Psychroserpens sp. TaxID=255436 RepID=UPI00260CDE0D|nr:hypothetical protein [uncultured Psychroserpens sp.]
MELVLASQKLEPSPKRRLATEFVRPEGLLNSNYKSVVKCNLNNTKSTSIFGIKQRVKSRQYQITSSIDTLLKLSVFVTVLAFIL